MQTMRPTLLPLTIAFLLAGVGAPVAGVTVAQDAAAPFPGTVSIPVGVTRAGTPIPAVVSRSAVDPGSPVFHVLLIGGLDGSRAGVERVRQAVEWFTTAPAAERYRRTFAVSAVLSANPDGLATGTGPANTSGGRVDRGYPPKGDAYTSPTDPEAAYLWRWIGIEGPDVVVVVVGDGPAAWRVPESLQAVFPTAQPLPASDGLAAQLNRVAAADVGTVPALEVAGDEGYLAKILAGFDTDAARRVSPAHAELRRRAARSPEAIAREVAATYGHEVSDMVYTQTVQLIGRLRLGSLAEVEAAVAPYVSGEKAALPKNMTSSHFSGHMAISELYRLTGKPQYLDMVKRVADLGFDDTGQPRESMPMLNEMSDGVFMGSPILAQAGALSGESRYFDMAVRNFRYMYGLDARADGLYRHSPLDESAWGRGNAFPALGLALTLTDLPTSHAGHADLVAAFRTHMTALARYQDGTGMWHQVVDHPESYREFTATAMIAVAMARGVKRGWLDAATFGPVVDRAWLALKRRMGPNGTFVDICTGTGKMKSLREYLDRAAILGQDPRGGAMALLAATEMMMR
ncbi:MAG: glycoside hydrolase family 88 protein [Vicinamibacterales bacterium]